MRDWVKNDPKVLQITNSRYDTDRRCDFVFQYSLGIFSKITIADLQFDCMGSSTKRKGARRLKPGVLLQQRYRIEQFIAEGGMNSVYRATDIRTGQTVAIKCLHDMYRDNEIVQARFIDEGRIQMLLKHPNVLRVFALIENPVLAFVMEYIEGGSLEDHLVQNGPMSQEIILDIMIPILSALGLAHSRGIIHRDLKPSNILMHRMPTGRYRPKVMDFGVAKVNRGRTLTQTGTTVGTLHYMSPEQIVGSKRIDGRADIYSIGITLYKLFTGEVPFNASTEFALMMAQVETPPRPPSQLRPDMSPRFESIILKSLAKKPQMRFQSIKEFTEALVKLSEQEDDTVTEQIGNGLLKYAMMADEVAEDKTRQIMRSEFDSLLNSLPDQTLIDDASDDSTVELESIKLDLIRKTDATASPYIRQEYEEEDPTQVVDVDDNFRNRLGIPTDSNPTLPTRDPQDDMPTTEVVRPNIQPPKIVGHKHVDSKELTRPKMETLPPQPSSGESTTGIMESLAFEDDIKTSPKASMEDINGAPTNDWKATLSLDKMEVAALDTSPMQTDRDALQMSTRPVDNQFAIEREVREAKRKKIMIGIGVASVVMIVLVALFIGVAFSGRIALMFK